MEKIIIYLGYFVSTLFFGLMGIIIPHYDKSSFTVDNPDLIPLILLLLLGFLYTVLFFKNKITKKFYFYNVGSFLFGFGMMLSIAIIKLLQRG